MVRDDQARKIQVAIHHYRQQLENHPDSAEAYVNLGNIYALQQEWTTAISHYRKAIKINSQFAGAYRNFARVLELSGKPKQALQKWYAALILEPHWFKPEEHYKIGQELQKYDQFKQAIECYRQAIQLKYDFLEAYHALAEIFIQQDNLDLAIKTYQTAIQHHFNHLEIYCKLGEIFVIQKNWEQVKLIYKQAITYYPNAIIIYLKLASALLEQKQWKKAIIYYQKVIELQPTNWETYYYIGQIWQHQQRWNKAINFYKKCLTLNPHCGSVYFEIGLIYFKQGDYVQAIAHYRKGMQYTLYESSIPINVLTSYYKVLNQFPTASANDYYQLARAFRSKSYFQDAINCYQQAIRIDPCFQLAYIDLQYTPIATEQLNSVITFYQNIIQSQKQSALAWGNLGDVLTQQGNQDLAIQCYQTSSYQKAIQINPSLVNFNWKQKKELGPDFIIIGAAKCGTTSFYEYLSEHPQILLPHKKELNFFTVHFQQSLEWYLAHFPTLADHSDFITGEATPAYFDYPNVPERIYNLFPNVKLIVLLRDPVERAISWHYHKVNTGFEKRSLEEVITSEFKKIQKINSLTEIKMNHKISNIFLGSLYIYYLKQWLSIFSKEQFLILQSEDLYTKPQKVLDKAFNFLGISSFNCSNYPICNQGSYPPIEVELKQTLTNFFHPYQEELKTFLEQHFS